MGPKHRRCTKATVFKNAVRWMMYSVQRQTGDSRGAFVRCPMRVICGVAHGLGFGHVLPPPRCRICHILGQVLRDTARLVLDALGLRTDTGFPWDSAGVRVPSEDQWTPVFAEFQGHRACVTSSDPMRVVLLEGMVWYGGELCRVRLENVQNNV